MILWNYTSSSALDTASDPGLPGSLASNDFILVRPASIIGKMRDPSWQGGVVCAETYHGTRMNKRALDFHTQLHDWSEAQKLSSIVKKHPRILSAKTNTEVYLPFKRLAQIENWTRDVNKFYQPERGPRGRSGSFMVIDVSKFNMKADENDRVKSAIYPSRIKPRLVSAVSAATTGARKRFFGTDVHTVSNKLVDTQMHYSAQRKDLYSASTKRSLLTNKTHDIKTEDETAVENLPESETETLSTFNTSTKPSEPTEETGPHIAQDILQPRITSRSWSNRMLNVISIDDCKLTCRYRPQTIKETHEPPDVEEKKNKDNNIKGKTSVKKNMKSALQAETEDHIGHEADDEGESSDVVADTVDCKVNGVHENGADTNNNENVKVLENDNDSERGGNDSTDNFEGDINDTGKDKVTANGENSSSNKTNGSLSSDVHVKKGAKINFQSDRGSTKSPTDKATSYGRITNLYSTSLLTSNTKEREKKKKGRVYKINHAITGMVKDRKVMNSMERDFDVRTSQFGRTIVEKSEGSETFQKLHSNLRKKIDSFLDTQSAMKTMQFYEQRRKNSSSASTPRENGLMNSK